MAGGQPGLVSTERIRDSILIIRGQKVILDSVLAELYGVETRALGQAVKRNPGRFPDDFMFQLTPEEHADLKSQSVISSAWGGRRTPPYASNEQGVAMLSSVLRSQLAVAVNVEIMRAFVRIRELIAGQTELGRRLNELEQRYDQQFRTVFDAIRALLGENAEPRKRIGFQSPEGG